MTIKGGTTPACAACKYQRRRCSPSCPLARYFPANDPKKFQNVHRLFGVSNITKTLKSLKTVEEQDEAMRSIVFEADIRQRYPVLGCYGVIHALYGQLQYAIEELRYVKRHLAACREQHLNSNINNNNNNNNNNNGSSLGIENEMNYGINQFLSDENGSIFVGTSSDNLGLGFDATTNNNLAALQAQMDAFGIQDETNIFPSDLERMQFSTRNDIEIQPYIESKEKFEPRVHPESRIDGSTSIERSRFHPQSSTDESTSVGRRKEAYSTVVAAKPWL